MAIKKMSKKEIRIFCKEQCEAWCCRHVKEAFSRDEQIKEDNNICVKLRANNTCSDFKNRPIACRMYKCPLLAFIGEKV